MQTTDNYELKVYEGTDKFNPLIVENVNTEKIDEEMFKISKTGVPTATELVNESVHAITRSNPDSAMFRFTATGDWNSGDTFTVDGIQVSAFLTTGASLGDKAYVINTEVLAVLVGTRMTVFCNSGAITTAQDSEKLGGELPSYYGTASAVASANTTANAANQLSLSLQTTVNSHSSAINGLDGQLKTTGNTKFYFDYKDGKYGFNTSSSRGADTFTPFSSGGATGELTLSASTTAITIDTGVKNLKAFSLLGGNSSYGHLSITCWKGEAPTKYATGRGSSGGITMTEATVGTAQSTYVAIMKVDSENGIVTIRPYNNAVITNYNSYRWFAV